MDDPAAVEVFRHRVAGVAEAMGACLQRAAYSPNIKERLDHSCAVFDQSGRLLAQAAHIPVHLGAMPAAVAAARRQIGRWTVGDVALLNDPFLGGSHLPDLTTVSPVFCGRSDSPALYVATRAHHADVGGAQPGSMGGARDLFGEGLILPPVRIVRGGALDTDLLAVVCANSRTPAERRGDLEAQLAAHRLGEHRLAELLSADPVGFARSARALRAYSERRARQGLSALPEGEYTFEDTLDDDDRGGPVRRVRVTVSIVDGTLTADFRGTARQVPDGVNAPRSVTVSAVYYVVACLLAGVPVNSGLFAPVRVRAPRGSLVNPTRPAAVAAGNVETSMRVVDVVLGALAAAAPDRIPAASQGTMNNVLVGGWDAARRRMYTYYETVGGGAGAAAGADGASGLQVHMTNTRNTPIEALEVDFPIRIEAYRLRPGSGGAGARSGGEGIERAMRFLAPARLTLVSQRRRSRPWGLAGGMPGAAGENTLRSAAGERDLPGSATLDVAAGDVLIVRTPGGGGWGAPPASAGADAGP